MAQAKVLQKTNQIFNVAGSIHSQSRRVEMHLDWNAANRSVTLQSPNYSEWYICH